MSPRRPVLALLAAAATAVGVAALPAAPATAGAPEQHWIVTLADGTAPRTVAALAKDLGGDVRYVYEHALRGFAVALPSAQLGALRALPGVTAVEADGAVQATETQTSPPSYGLDRIDQRALPLSKTYTWTANGAGVTAYVIDTGIRTTHSDFGGRATSGYDAIDGGAADDCNGHGTHVAGTVGGTKYGVAKGVSLVAVRVLNCAGSGSTSGGIAGVDRVTGHHQPGQPAVANMSLGGGASTALDTAVKRSVADGVTYALAAGNDGGTVGELTGAADACNGSPSRVAEGLTVGATDANDNKASYSSRGKCLDLFAPGSSIPSAWYTSDTATNTISGTSMATPHVAGVAALLLQTAPSLLPADVHAQVVAAATTGVVKNPGTGSPNRLLFTSY